jgi:flagellar FliL protein
MATPPTVLADAASTPAIPVAIPTQAKIPLGPLMIAVIAGVLIAILCVGGGMYYLVRSGRLLSQTTTSTKTESAVALITHPIVLDPMLVNLADVNGSAYLRVSLALRVVDQGGKKNSKPTDEKTASLNDSGVTAALRDTALTVLGRQTSGGLLASDGKENLKKQLQLAFAQHNSDVKVANVFFTDFLVQR